MRINRSPLAAWSSLVQKELEEAHSLAEKQRQVQADLRAANRSLDLRLDTAMQNNAKLAEERDQQRKRVHELGQTVAAAAAAAAPAALPHPDLVSPQWDRERQELLAALQHRDAQLQRVVEAQKQLQVHVQRQADELTASREAEGRLRQQLASRPPDADQQRGAPIPPPGDPPSAATAAAVAALQKECQNYRDLLLAKVQEVSMLNAEVRQRKSEALAALAAKATSEQELERWQAAAWAANAAETTPANSLPRRAEADLTVALAEAQARAEEYRDLSRLVSVGVEGGVTCSRYFIAAAWDW